MLVKFYCDLIARSRLQLINTLISAFFSKLGAWNKEEEGRPVMVKRKLDSVVDKSSGDQEIFKFNSTVHNL